MSDEVLKNKRGYMALRNNVWETRMQLWNELLPFELHLVDLITCKTIKWRMDEAKITIEELVELCGKNRSWVYRGLKSLEQKRVILRRKERHDLIIGLNPQFFGELLIKKHQEALQSRRSKIKIIVDNSKNSVPAGHVKCPSRTLLSSCQNTESVPAGHKIHTQHFDIIEENRPLNTLLKDISLNTLLKDSKNENGESFTLSGKREPKKRIPSATNSSEAQDEIKRQFYELNLKAGSK